MTSQDLLQHPYTILVSENLLEVRLGFTSSPKPLRSTWGPPSQRRRCSLNVIDRSPADQEAALLGLKEGAARPATAAASWSSSNPACGSSDTLFSVCLDKIGDSSSTDSKRPGRSGVATRSTHVRPASWRRKGVA